MLVKNLTPFPFGAKPVHRRPEQPEMALIVRGTFRFEHGAQAVIQEEDPSSGAASLTGEIFGPEDEARTGDLLYPGDLADFKPRADLLLSGTCHVPGGRPVERCPVRFSVGAFSKVVEVVGPRTLLSSAFGDHLSDPARFTKKKLTAAELGPVSPYSPERARKLGTAYGPEWRKKRAPAYAEDFDPGYFNAAPEDQQVPYLRGDEAIAFVNLHPDRVLFESRLPGLAVRAFVNDAEGRFREVPLALDTLLADMDSRSLTLVWRGLDAVRDPELRDVRTVLFASEPLGASQPVSHYRALLEAFEADPIRGSLPASFDKDLWAGVEIPAPPAEKASKKPETAGQKAMNEQLERTLAMLPAGLREAVSRTVSSLGARTRSRGVDLPARVAEGLQAKGNGLSPPSATAPLLDARVRPALSRKLEALRGIARDARQKGVHVPGLESIEAALQNPQLAAIPERDSDAPGGAKEPSPGGDFAGVDWSGRDLKGADLAGADLRGALLVGADLRGARLQGANLEQAVLTGARLEEADLSGASLRMAQLTGAKAKGASLREASLDGLFGEEVDFEEADLTGIVAERAILTKANLSGARLSGARLTQCVCEGARLDRATLSGARLERCMLTQITAEGSDWTGASLAGSGLSEGQLQRARLVDLSAPRSVWIRADLTSADLSFAVLRGACLSEVDASLARLFGADLRDARLDRARLDNASLERANLFGADLRRASLARASLRHANLFEAVLLGATKPGADLTGASLKRAIVDPS